MRGALLIAALLAGCDRAAPTAATPGAAIEASAISAGMIVDPARASPIGAWARDTDRLCIAPGAGEQLRVGISVDYAERQSCLGRGVAIRHGDRIEMNLGDCRIGAAFEGDRIVLPSTLPAACDRLCIGRASLAALSVERQSGSAADAAAMAAPDGSALCPGGSD